MGGEFIGQEVTSGSLSSYERIGGSRLESAGMCKGTEGPDLGPTGGFSSPYTRYTTLRLREIDEVLHRWSGLAPQEADRERRGSWDGSYCSTRSRGPIQMLP